MKILSRLYFPLTYILLPLLILLSVIFILLTDSDFYVRILKNADLIENYINAEKWKTEEKIKKEIDEKVHLEKYRDISKSLKNNYENKLRTYNELKKEYEYNELIKQKEDISNLTYQQAPKSIRNPEEFKKYREEETGRIESLIKGIVEYRKENKYLIEKVMNEVESLDDVYRDSEETLKDKENEAKKIIESNEDTFKGQIVSDLKKINPVLTNELNDKLIDTQMRSVIDEYINYFSNYFTNIEAGNIYTDSLDNYVSGGNRLHIILPEKSITLYVDYEQDGKVQKKHLLSEIFVEKVKEIKGLKNSKEIQKTLIFMESGMAEMIGGSYLNRAGISLQNGVIMFRERELTGSSAEIVKYVMLFFTAGKYLKYILPVLAFLILISLFFEKDKIKKHNRIKHVLMYPSFLMILFTIFFVFFVSGIPNILKMNAMSLSYIYFKSILNTAAINLLMPCAIFFLLLFVTGFFLKRKQNK